jgi:phosphopantothenoylcysteine decarboxylase/phosphopantothenate--cysteine ligase
MRFLISAGPTREKIDPVRFISNRSSGKMGYALAEAALKAGHEVSLVSGPVNLPRPEGAEFVKVESAEEMAREIKRLFHNADITIMAAAVADYRPSTVSSQKIKKTDGRLILEFERTEDILASLGQLKEPGKTLVGFAAETQDLIDNTKDKLKRKNLDWIIANDVSKADRGFASDQNAVTMISSKGEKTELPLAGKKELAEKIISILTKIL